MRWIAVVAGAVLTVGTDRAAACSCLAPSLDPVQAVRDAHSGADAVFLGRVTQKDAVPHAEGLAMLDVTFAVERRWKGSDDSTMHVQTPASSAACGLTFQLDREYLVFASRERATGLYTATLCSLTRPASHARQYIEILDTPGPMTNR